MATRVTPFGRADENFRDKSSIEESQPNKKANYYLRNAYPEASKEIAGEGGCCSCLASLTSITLFVLGCIAAANGFDLPTTSWIAICMGGGLLLQKLLEGNLKNRKIVLIFAALVTATIVTLGILGLSSINYLTAKQIGWGIVGTQLASWFIPGFCIDRWQRTSLEQQISDLAQEKTNTKFSATEAKRGLDTTQPLLDD